MESNGTGQTMRMPEAGEAQRSARQTGPEPSKMQMTAGMSGYQQDKKARGMKIGLIIAVIVAVIGIGASIGVGVASSQAGAEYETQIAKLEAENEELNESLETGTVTIQNEDGTVTEVEVLVPVRSKNPVIKSDDVEKRYSMGLTSSREMTDGSSSADGFTQIWVTINEGKVSRCELRYYDLDGQYIDSDDCTIDGLDGEIYKAVEFGAGQDSSSNSVGFIMTDGTVKYFPLLDIIGGTSYNIAGTLKIDGFVTDAIDVAVGYANAVGGYRATIFVLSDGSYVEYNEAMK